MRVLVILGLSAVVLVSFLLALIYGVGAGARAHDQAAEAVTPEEWGEHDDEPELGNYAEMADGWHAPAHIGTLMPGQAARVTWDRETGAPIVEKFYPEEKSPDA
jgi:hypothetical protein